MCQPASSPCRSQKDNGEATRILKESQGPSLHSGRQNQGGAFSFLGTEIIYLLLVTSPELYIPMSVFKDVFSYVHDTISCLAEGHSSCRHLQVLHQAQPPVHKPSVNATDKKGSPNSAPNSLSHLRQVPPSLLPPLGSTTC